MFKIIGMDGCIHKAYGTFIDEDGDIQFILCDSDGVFYKTNATSRYYRLYDTNIMNNDEARKILKRDLDIMIQNKCLPDSIEAMKVAISALSKYV